MIVVEEFGRERRNVYSARKENREGRGREGGRTIPGPF
jgi:hypothetical protein